MNNNKNVNANWHNAIIIDINVKVAIWNDQIDNQFAVSS